MISKALKSLYPNAEWAIEDEDYNKIRWTKNQPNLLPTLEQLQQEAARLEEVEISLEYQRKRRTEYPSVADQLDMLWHAMDTGALPRVDSFYDAIKAVKDTNPKP
jgi:hypothetical protein